VTAPQLTPADQEVRLAEFNALRQEIVQRAACR